jgi:hypothetical protein
MQAAERNKGLVIEPGRKAHRGSGVTLGSAGPRAGHKGMVMPPPPKHAPMIWLCYGLVTEPSKGHLRRRRRELK